MTEAADQANALGDIQPFAPETLIDPWDVYKRLRDNAPVYHVPEMAMHYVTRYDLVREVLKDTQTYSSKFDAFMMMARSASLSSLPEETQNTLRAISKELIEVPPTMLTLDEPEHTKYRSLVSQLFTGSQVKKSEEQVREVIEQTADAMLEAWTPDGSMDYMAQFAFPVPLTIIAERLGIPAEDRPLFDDGATAAAAGLRMSAIPPDEEVRLAQLAVDLQNLLVRLIEARREDPRDDMISILATSRLQEEDRHLTHGEALSILNQFLVAGHETTTSTFGWGMLILCRNPELQDQLRQDPSLTRTFVEEALRVEAPVQGLPRVVTRDTELGGYPIKAGEFVMLRYGAANRDERQFPDPDKVDPHRSKAGMQLAFGSGVHHCIGAPLARQELNLGFPALLERMENIRLDESAPPPEAEPSFILRNLPELHIRFDRR
ncbi:MAG: cytochrome P450 [Pseudomonadota bacterium]